MESATLSPILPQELIDEILLRLPVRSLLRFKCVCKCWLSLISDPEFGKSHFDLAASPTHRYLVRKINDSSEIESLDVDASSLNYESAVVKIKLPFPSSKSQVETSFHQNPAFVLGSCRGFVVLAYQRGAVIVWNPSTDLQRRIGGDNMGSCVEEFLNGFGYDSSTDDYLLVCVRLIPLDYLHEGIDDYRCHLEFFSLRTSSWIEMEGQGTKYKVQYVDTDHFDSRIGSLLNEALHWLVISFDTKLHVIIAFDLVERSLSEVPLSNNLARKLTEKKYYLRVMGECLTLCHPGGLISTAEVWMMKKYKVQSSWTKLFKFSTWNIPRNVFYPKCLTKHGGFFGSNGSRRLMILNGKGLLLDQCTLPERDKYQYIQVDSGMYRESLLSLPCDIEEASEDDQLTSSLEEAGKDGQK